MKYSLSSIKTAIEKPRASARELNRDYYNRKEEDNYNPNGTNLLEEDWDNLIILDACRYDLFREVSTLPGETESRISLASATKEWVPATFSDRILHDTVYVTINSHYTRMRNKIGSDIHSLIDVNQMDHEPSEYDELFNIPHPEVVTEYALQAASDYPRKRLIVHHNVPHYPYLSKFGRDRFPIPSSALSEVVGKVNKKNLHGDVIKAYKKNIEIGIREVKRFYSQVSGKTVVTADHGEMLGERHRFFPVRDWGHPRGVYNSYLTEVPWHVLPYDNRRNTEEGQPGEKDRVDKEKVRKNLELLGYM